MLTRDQNVDANSLLVRRSMTMSLAPAISLVNECAFLYRAPHNLQVLGAQVYCRTTAGTVAVQLYRATDTQIVLPGLLAIDATPEKFKLITNTIIATVAGVVIRKAPTTANVFSAAYTVNNAQGAGTAHWGAFLVSINASGTVSTKAVSADQDYATEALAIAALPAADAGKVAVGYITVQAKTGGLKWTANTDDLTPTSDCTTAHFVNTAAGPTVTSSITPVAADSVDAVMTAGNGALAEDENLLVLVNTDGSGALVDGRLTIDYSARGYRGGN